MDVQREILVELEAVEAERRLREQLHGLGERVVRLKAYQQRRFSQTYADLLASARYRSAARFFLDDLYGPRDFTGRDAQFARIVPSIVRLFPQEVVGTVLRLARLHSLSEQLDTAMARALLPTKVDWTAESYAQAWTAVGREADRRRQVAWTVEVGRGLERLVAKPLLVRSLKLMRGPAAVSGLGELQAFLERGLGAFSAMRGAGDFLRIIDQRESALLRFLFDDAGTGLAAGPKPGSGTDDLGAILFGQLP